VSCFNIFQRLWGLEKLLKVLREGPHPQLEMELYGGLLFVQREADISC
jgi:hypothetical protein